MKPASRLSRAERQQARRLLQQARGLGRLAALLGLPAQVEEAAIHAAEARSLLDAGRKPRQGGQGFAAGSAGL